MELTKAENIKKMKVKVKSLSHVQLFATPWTVAHQAPPSKGFSRQEYWSRSPFPSPGDLPDPGIEPKSPTLQADALTSEPPGKPDIKKRRQEYTEELYKKDLHDPYNHDGVITHLERKCYTQYASKFGKRRSTYKIGKVQFSIQSQRKAMPKNVQTTVQLHSPHTLAK